MPWKPWTYLPDVLRKDYLLLALVKISVSGARSRAAAAARYLDAGILLFFVAAGTALVGRITDLLSKLLVDGGWWMLENTKTSEIAVKGRRDAIVHRYNQ